MTTVEEKERPGNPCSWHCLEDHYIQAGNVRTRYWQLGDGGSPVVLLHGLGSYLNSWCLNMAPLAARHRVYAPDLIGHGYTDKPAVSYSLDCFVGFLQDFLDALGLGRSHLVGHSWGGAVALRFAVLYPERVGRLVLAGSSGLGPEVSFWLRLMTLPYISFRAARLSRKALQLISRRVISRPEKRTPEWVGMTQERLYLPGVRKVVRAVARNHLNLFGIRSDSLQLLEDELPRLAVPTLVIHGANDWLIPPSNTAFARSLNPRLQVKILEQCGHELQYECADDFNALVLDFLSE
ncbi:MAG TPA: alpha/beta fold hydrolase [Acidobacteriota bacterium]|nr:alpha/beta fold hydrolase [Acidobacteriota bacterium]